MKVADLRPGAIARQLRRGEFAFSIGAFDIRLQSSLAAVHQAVPELYGDYPMCAPDPIVDFHIALEPPGMLRRWMRPQVQFVFDGQVPFKPLPQVQAFAMFEWGLNWCIANHAHEFLVIHAAVVERQGHGFLFPGTPGSGKSTLCAALVNSGWRLLSDEMALISLHDGLVWPVPRPISLKNASIDIVRALAPATTIGAPVSDTAKGTIAHMRAPRASVMAAMEPARPCRVVFPHYRAEAACSLAPLSKGQAFMKMAANAFNYHVLGMAGFDALARTMDVCTAHTLTYARTEDAMAVVEDLNRAG